jgi:hypothetical protein
MNASGFLAAEVLPRSQSTASTSASSGRDWISRRAWALLGAGLPATCLPARKVPMWPSCYWPVPLHTDPIRPHLVPGLEVIGEASTGEEAA